MYFAIALLSLWGTELLSGFPIPTLRAVMMETADMCILLDTALLSNSWCRLRASGHYDLLPQFLIYLVGFEVGRGPWIRFQCTV